MLLVYTTSYDTTVDLLIHHMGPDDVFRLNFDLWRDYKLEITPDGFRLEDPTGRIADEASIAKVLWRKPFKTALLAAEVELEAEDRYYEEELWYAVRELVNLLWCEQKVVLVEPLADLRVGKFVQARVAAQYFTVPEFQFRRGEVSRPFAGREIVAKSLTSESVCGDGDKSVLYATRVADDELSTDVPWMVQEYVAADADVTVVCVRGRLFAFQLDRAPFLDDTIDWRELPVDMTCENWQPHELPQDVDDGIRALMRELRLDFGRLDFLVHDGRYHFLEVNPNGQWAWLDAEGKHGVLDAIVDVISPRTPCHPIPVLPGVVLPALSPAVH
jgi:hypothetical protein